MDLGPKAEMREIRTSGRLCLDRRCSKDSGVALEVALRFAESYRRNGMLSLDIKEFGAQGETNVGTGTDPTIAGTLKEMPTFAKPG